MAAYAALNSVMFILQQIQHHPRPPITIEKQQMESLCENISSLQHFLENYSHRDMGDRKEALESQIADAAYAAEDVIESHIVDQILSEKISDYNLFCKDLQNVIEDMNLIKKEAIQIQEKIGGINDDQLPINIISMPANIIGSSTVPPPKRKNTNTMVGFDDVLIQIMDRLTGHPPNRQVLPIIGMGGSGKTTLARHAYVNPLIVKHFDIRVWVTISQEYRLRDILLQALSSSQNDENKSSEDELGVQLHKSLHGRRYLMVLDDMWSIEAWEKLMLFFPDNNNGSRIMITTRLSNVSNHFGSCDFKMNFLDEDKSWELFCNIVFGQDQFCPPELENIGKKIAGNCKGLPLSIAVIGGLLEKSEKTRQRWEYVMKNLNSIVNLEDEMHCLKILYLSYNHLPIHLKPCFLYVGVFPEDSIISVPRLKKLWVAEGFLKPIAAKSLEEVAEEYLKDLIDRNLILVHVLGSSGKVKYCKIHDLLRDLCLREGQKDKFLWVSEVHDFDNREGIQSRRRISLHKGAIKKEYAIDRFLEPVPLPSLARSLTCHSNDVHLLSGRYRLVRVFNFNMVRTYSFIHKKMKNVFKFVNSRYLDIRPELKLTTIFPRSIHQLWNLQTLIINVGSIIDVLQEIWELSQLRHLEICKHFSLPDPPKVPLIHEGDEDDFILRNLHTLNRVVNLKLSEEVIKRIPNVKKLRVSYHDDEGWWQRYCVNNLRLLNKLESLNMGCRMPSKWSPRNELLKNHAFPRSLKKLSLDGIHLHWEDMRMIGSLPHLQVLKLYGNSFYGDEWNPVEGEFLCLKFLLIGGNPDLAYWNANITHFPSLERLVLSHLLHLKEIPSDIGQIPTLRYIELQHCIYSLVMSVKNVLDEQVELGNDDLQVRVVCENKGELERLATHNFQVEVEVEVEDSIIGN